MTLFHCSLNVADVWMGCWEGRLRQGERGRRRSGEGEVKGGEGVEGMMKSERDYII